MAFSLLLLAAFAASSAALSQYEANGSEPGVSVGGGDRLFYSSSTVI